MEQHDDFESNAKLLPFYINGTLDAAACARLDKALAISPELRAEMAQINSLAQLVKAGGNEMVQDVQANEGRLAQVLDKLDNAPQFVPEKTIAPTPQANFLRFLNPRHWHPAVALSLAIAVAGQALMIGGLSKEKQQSSAQIAGLQKKVGDLEFELASGPNGPRNGDLLIVIKPDASWAQLEALLGREGLSIVSGPSDGAITLSSEDKGPELDALITRLRASTLIASADKAA